MFLKDDFVRILRRYNPESVEFGKDLAYLCFRNNASKEEFVNEIFSPENLQIIEKQEINNEERFALYFIYSKTRGRVYILRFYSEKIRVITIFPLGRRTLNKYFKRKFKI